MKTSTCRSCEAEIVWATTVTGKSMPMDATPARGLFVLTESELGVVQAFAAEGEVYVSHFSTCPNAAQHRKAS